RRGELPEPRRDPARQEGADAHGGDDGDAEEGGEGVDVAGRVLLAPALDLLVGVDELAHLLQLVEPRSIGREHRRELGPPGDRLLVELVVSEALVLLLFWRSR